MQQTYKTVGISILLFLIIAAPLLYSTGTPHIDNKFIKHFVYNVINVVLRSEIVLTILTDQKTSFKAYYRTSSAPFSEAKTTTTKPSFVTKHRLSKVSLPAYWLENSFLRALRDFRLDPEGTSQFTIRKLCIEYYIQLVNREKECYSPNDLTKQFTTNTDLTVEHQTNDFIHLKITGNDPQLHFSEETNQFLKSELVIWQFYSVFILTCLLVFSACIALSYLLIRFTALNAWRIWIIDDPSSINKLLFKPAWYRIFFLFLLTLFCFTACNGFNSQGRLIVEITTLPSYNWISKKTVDNLNLSNMQTRKSFRLYFRTDKIFVGDEFVYDTNNRTQSEHTLRFSIPLEKLKGFLLDVPHTTPLSIKQLCVTSIWRKHIKRHTCLKPLDISYFFHTNKDIEISSIITSERIEFRIVGADPQVSSSETLLPLIVNERDQHQLLLNDYYYRLFLVFFVVIATTILLPFCRALILRINNWLSQDRTYIVETTSFNKIP